MIILSWFAAGSRVPTHWRYTANNLNLCITICMLCNCRQQTKQNARITVIENNTVFEESISKLWFQQVCVLNCKENKRAPASAELRVHNVNYNFTPDSIFKCIVVRYCFIYCDVINALFTIIIITSSFYTFINACTGCRVCTYYFNLFGSSPHFKPGSTMSFFLRTLCPVVLITPFRLTPSFNRQTPSHSHSVVQDMPKPAYHAFTTSTFTTSTTASTSKRRFSWHSVLQSLTTHPPDFRSTSQLSPACSFCYTRLIWELKKYVLLGTHFLHFLPALAELSNKLI